MALTGLDTNWLTSSYFNDRDFLLKVAENNPLRLGIDNTGLSPHFDENNSIALGYGFDLITSGNTAGYLAQVGITLTQNAKNILAQATTTRNQIRNIQLQLQSASGTTAQQLQTQLDALMNNMRTYAVQLQQEGVTLNDETRAAQLLRAVANDKEQALIVSLGADMPQDSRERAVLVSLYYQSASYIGPKLRTALHNDDRAEVWFQIRYDSNADGLPGIAKRRFFEADYFGLYDNRDAFADGVQSTANDEDAKSAFRVMTRHKATIEAYEQRWSGQITQARSDYGASSAGQPAIDVNFVRTLTDDLQPARTYLTTQYGQGVNIDGDILVGESDGTAGTSDTRYYRNTDADLLTGSTNSDLLFGESGNDLLDGGRGQDVLYGGAGQDIYRIRPEDGNDIIIDSDGQGLIRYGADGQERGLTLGIRNATDPAGEYKSQDGMVTYRLNGPDLTVTLPNQQRITVRNYTPGDLHLALLDQPADPSGSILTGTESNNADVTDTGVPDGVAGGGVLDRNWQGYQPLGQLSYPASGEPGGLYFLSRDGSNLTYQTILGQGGDDFLLGNPGAQNIKLDGGTGNDWIISDYNDIYSAFQGSTVYTPGPGVTLDGGSGNDTLQGGFHDDWIEGGTGHDQLYGGQGDDYLAGGTGNDWLAASDGDDVIVGGPDTATNGETDNDTLLGGAGSDNLIGGIGDDALYGDTGGGFLRQVVNVGNGTLALVAWNGAAQQYLIPNFVGAAFQEPLLTDVPLSDAGDDYLDGGAGNDKLFGGAGSDILDGGADNDKLYGEAGDDVLFGSAGNDELWGDKDAAAVARDRQISETHGALSLFNREYQDGAEVAGNDVLDGGAGDDKLYGGKGNDTYLFGLGYDQDTIRDDGGTDTLRLGAGITPDRVNLSLYADGSLELDVAGTADTLTIQNWRTPANRIEYLQFADGTLWDSQAVWKQLGNRTTLRTGDGVNTFTRVADLDPPVFHFPDGITPSSLSLSQYLANDGTQYLRIGYGANDAISIKNGLLDFGQTYEVGTQTLAQRDLLQYAPGLVTLGTDSADTIYGSNQADTLIGNNGNDTLEGRKGDDTLEGGIGFDTYIYNFGDGTDTILDADGLGKIVYRDAQGTEYTLGASPSGEEGRFTYGMSGRTLTVTLDGQTALIIQNYDPLLSNLGIQPTYQTPEIPSEPLEPIRRVSVAADGTQANSASSFGRTGSSSFSLISTDGRYVAFYSYANNLVRGDTNGRPDVFVKDLLTGAITLVGPASSLTSHSLSTAGRYEAFHSDATDLVAGDTNGARDVFVKDLQTGAIVRASTAADGTQGNDWSQIPTISANGRYVAFESYATNLMGNDANGSAPDIFVKDLQTGAIVRASTAADGAQANNESTVASLSADGRYVAFNSKASNLVAGDTNNVRDIFVKDLQTGAIARVTATDGAQPNGESHVPFLSADGRYVVFESGATNLVAGDTNRFGDIFIAPNPFFPSSSGGSGETFYSSGGDEAISGGMGDDLITLSNGGTKLVFGGYGNDTIVINAANLPSAQGVSGIFLGGLGNDTYIYYPTVGSNIRIVDLSEPSYGNSLVINSSYGSLQLGLGSLRIQVGDNGGVIHLENFDPNDVYGAHAIETFKFADGTVLSYADLIAKGFDLTGTDGDEAIIGTNATDRITGGWGDDALSGGAGDDTYFYALGDGSDTIQDNAGNDAFALTGIALADLNTSVSSDDLVLELPDGNTITVWDWFLDAGNQIETVTLDGTGYTGSFIAAWGRAPVVAAPVPDITTDEDGSFNLDISTYFTDADLGRGDVLSYSAALADSSDLPTWLAFDATAGVFTGTPDNWQVGSYDIRITATDAVGRFASDAFTLMVHNVNDAPVLANPLSDQMATEGVVFSYALAGDTFQDDDALHGDTLSYVATLADGGDLPSWLTFDTTTQTFAGTASADSVLVGTDGDDILVDTDIGISGTWDIQITATDTSGVSADDMFTLTLQGVPGNDTLTGGKGNDTLNGGAGDDTYLYNQGDGLDTLTDREGQDTVSFFGSGFSFDNTVIRVDSTTGIAHLRFLDDCGCETQEGMDITLNPDGSSPIETFAFADGTSYTLSDLTIQQKTWYGDKKANTIITGRHDDTIYAGKGGDTVYAGTGNDTLYGEKGNDRLYGEGGNDALFGDKGDDYLNGGCGNDLLDGGKGHNTLIGGEGNDTLILGKDSENKIYFNQGDGWDTLKTAAKDEDHDNDIYFGNGITQENLWFTRNSDNLLINVLGTNDGMTLEGWYTDKHRPIEEIKTANGYELEDKQIDLLVQAMAAFSPIPGSGNVLPAEMPEQLQPVLAAAWES